jgi:outer membrane autotransporter protein
MNFIRILLTLACLAVGMQANAGHLFTQNSINTPISLTSGQGIEVTQSTYEGGGTDGDVSINFGGDWDAGDVMKITIGSYTQTFSYDSPLAGTSQGGSSLYVNDPTLDALDLGGTFAADEKWYVVAVAGDFTWEGYRIYLTGQTFNGTGAGPINQTQVVDAGSLGGGVFEPVSTSNTSSTGQILDQLNGTVSGAMATIITDMAALSDDDRQAAVQKVSPETGSALAQAATQTITGSLDTVQIRLDSLRSESFSTTALTYDAETGLAAGDEQYRNSMWIKAFGATANQGGNDGFAGYGSNIHGLAAGTDTLLDNDWVLGGAFTYASTDVDMGDFRSGDSTDIETWQLTAYASRDYGKWYIETMLAYAYQDYDTRRDTGVSGVAVGDFSGDMFALRVLAGMPFHKDSGITITPYAGLEYSYMTLDSYTETGAGVMSLNAAEQDLDRGWLLLGAKVSKEFMTENGAEVIPSVQFGLRHALNNDGIDTVTSFVGGGGNFISEGQDIHRNVYSIGLGVAVKQSDNFTLSVSLDTELADEYESYQGQVIGNWTF